MHLKDLVAFADRRSSFGGLLIPSVIQTVMTGLDFNVIFYSVANGALAACVSYHLFPGYF